MTQAVRLALALGIVCGAAAAAGAQEDEYPNGRAILERAGYRFDDSTLLIQAMRDGDPMVAVAAASYLIKRPPTQETIAAFHLASRSDWGSVAMVGFRGLLQMRQTGWEEAAVARMHKDPRDRVMQIELAGLLADAGRSDGWSIVRDALAPDHPGMGLAVRNAARFDGLKDPAGVDIDAVSELGRLRTQLKGRGKSGEELYKVDIAVVEADARAKERKARGKR